MSQRRKLIIGSRGSRLALQQAAMVKDLIQNQNPELEIEIKIIKTQGDIILDTPLGKIGDKGLFTKELENALLHRKIDLAVHSMKDLPIEIPTGLEIAAILQREDPHDAFVSHKYNNLHELPKHATVATSSLRRRAQVLAFRSDLQTVDIRGNVDTRLRKMISLNYDGMLLAVAGLKRLQLDSEIKEIIAEEVILPAVGQGALGIEVRQDDRYTLKQVQPLNHQPTAQAVAAERALLQALGGGCQVPLGALARVEKNRLNLKAIICDLEGTVVVKGQKSGKSNIAEQIGFELAHQLIANGASKILESIHG